MFYLVFLLAFQSSLFSQFFTSCKRTAKNDQKEEKVLTHEDRKQEILKRLEKEYSYNNFDELYSFYHKIQNLLDEHPIESIKDKKIVYNPYSLFLYKKTKPNNISELTNLIYDIIKDDFVSDNNSVLLYKVFDDVVSFYMYYDRVNNLIFNRFYWNYQNPNPGPKL